jgi:multiple sugar transport system ATP-binding protein
LFVAGFIGSPAMNILPGATGEGGFVAEGGAVLPTPPGKRNGAGYYGIRPEHLRLDDNGLAATVQIVEPTGSETQVMVRIGDTPLTCAFRERVTAGPGETIRISPDLGLVHLFEKGSGQRIAN